MGPAWVLEPVSTPGSNVTLAVYQQLVSRAAPGCPRSCQSRGGQGERVAPSPAKRHSIRKGNQGRTSRPREPSLLGQCERSDHRESTDTRQLIEVKPYRARLVLRWVTTLESRVALSFLFAIFGIFFCPPAPCALPGPSGLHAKRSRKSRRD